MKKLSIFFVMLFAAITLFIGTSCNHNHNFYRKVMDLSTLKEEANCSHGSIYYKSCWCGEISTTETFEFIDKGTHTFDKQVSTADYLVEEATCSHGTLYKMSCECGLASETETFEANDQLPHTFDQEVSSSIYIKDVATCTSKAVYYKSCTCGEASTTDTFEYGNFAEHVYNQEVDSQDYYKEELQDGTKVYYKSCICGAAGTATFEVSGTPVYNVSNYYDGYYSSLVSWTDSEDLIEQLHNIIHSTSFQSLNYAPSGSKTVNWETNINADQSLYNYNYVDVVYSTTDELKTKTNTEWQREHAFCGSLMTGSQTGDAVKYLGRATDFHNLFAGDTTGNTSRGNKNFGEVEVGSAGYKEVYNDAGVLQYKYNNLYFEPGDEDKARVARAIFYMTIMWNEDDYDTANSINMAPLTVQEDYVYYGSKDPNYNAETYQYSAFAIGSLSTLYDWALMDVDLLEYQHNQSVYSYVRDGVCQGNRNPFVDYPELIEYIYGDKKDQAGELKYLEPSYHKLGLGSTDKFYYAVGEYKDTYVVGSKIKKSDFTVYCVDKTLNKVTTTDFDLVGVTEGQTLNTAGKVKLTIDTDLNDIEFYINVVEEDPIDTASYSHHFEKADLSTDSSTKKGSFTAEGIKWNITLGNYKAPGNANANKGIQLSSSSTAISTFTLSSDEDFDISGHDMVNQIAFRGSTASGVTYNVTFKVGGNVVGTSTISYVKGEYSTVVCKLAQPASGKVEIIISNITSGFYVDSFSVNCE